MSENYEKNVFYLEQTFFKSLNQSVLQISEWAKVKFQPFMKQ